MVVIHSECLVLREFDETDRQAVHSYASDPEVVRYMDWGPNTTEETKSSSVGQLPTRKNSLAETTYSR